MPSGIFVRLSCCPTQINERNYSCAFYDEIRSLRGRIRECKCELHTGKYMTHNTLERNANLGRHIYEARGAPTGKVRRLLIEKFYEARVRRATISSPNPLNGIVEKGCPNDSRDSSLFRCHALSSRFLRHITALVQFKPSLFIVQKLQYGRGDYWTLCIYDKFVKMCLNTRNMERYKKCRNYVVIIVIIDRYVEIYCRGILPEFALI